jgi:hypothetical protein
MCTHEERSLLLDAVSEAWFLLSEVQAKTVEDLLSGLFLYTFTNHGPQVLLETESLHTALASAEMPIDDRTMHPAHLIIEVEVDVRECVFAAMSTHGRRP